MSDRGGHIGVFDSGIGGLNILRALRAELPHEDFLYIADSGHAPYGERDEAHVLARSRAIARHLAGQHVKALVIACNTATAAAIHILRAEHPGLPIIGVEPALKPAAHASHTRRIGVMATRSTLCSARFRALLAAQAPSAEFILQACDGLADAIERSAYSGVATEVIALCARYIRVMGRFGSSTGEIDTLVLGCTHYPFATEALRSLVDPEVQILDNGAAVARQTRRLLAATTAPAQLAPGKITLLTTGNPQTLGAATDRWLGLLAAVQALQVE